MIASAKPEVEVACSTSPAWRATSRVTAPSSRVTKTASSIFWAASVSPRWRSIITELRMTAVGLMTFLPAYLGAEPWTASKMATSSP